jgi:hypothetical protein
MQRMMMTWKRKRKGRRSLKRRYEQEPSTRLKVQQERPLSQGRPHVPIGKGEKGMT